MYLNNFIQLNESTIQLYFKDGSTKTIYLNEDSGKTVYRGKKWTIFNVLHTGIMIGHDIYGEEYVAHCHIDNKVATIDTLTAFLKNKPYSFHVGDCDNSPLKIVTNALQAVEDQVEYSIFFNNCQHFTSLACNNKKESPDLVKVVTGVTAVAGGVYCLKRNSPLAKALALILFIIAIGIACSSSFEGKELSL